MSSFCIAKATHVFSAKNIRIVCIESAKTVNEMTLNELVKLTTLWTTGPGILSINTILIYFMINIEKVLWYSIVSDFWYLYFYFLFYFILFYFIFIYLFIFCFFVIPCSSILKVPQHTFIWKAPFCFLKQNKKKKKDQQILSVKLCMDRVTSLYNLHIYKQWTLVTTTTFVPKDVVIKMNLLL